jgi:hypothetical protein
MAGFVGVDLLAKACEVQAARPQLPYAPVRASQSPAAAAILRPEEYWRVCMGDEDCLFL